MICNKENLNKLFTAVMTFISFGIVIFVGLAIAYNFQEVTYAPCDSITVTNETYTSSDTGQHLSAWGLRNVQCKIIAAYNLVYNLIL